MSLINQMLRDLDQQRGSASCDQVAALRGLGLVDRHRRRRSRVLPVFGGALVIAITAALGYWTADRLFSEQSTVVVTTPAANVSATATPETVQTPTPKTPLAPAVNEQTIQQTDKPQPSAATESLATPLEKAASPPRGAIASIETQPVIKPAPVMDTQAESPARVRTLSPVQKAERIYNRAQQALVMNRKDDASRLLEQALAEDPRHTAARQQLAMLMIQDHQPLRAEALLADGLAISPGRLELAHAYAQLLVERGAFVPALESLQNLDNDHAAGAETLALQAGIMTRLQHYADAVETYRRALRQHPHQAVWWTGLGVALEHDGRAASALDAYRRAAQLPLQTDVKRFVQQRIQALSSLGEGSQG